ncbi:MAG: amidohydrolase [Selenomonadaceae bacterium]|nr:amidohydrolase [Selenomonadaceae bacterium]
MRRRSFIRLIGIGAVALALGSWRAFGVEETSKHGKVDFHAHPILLSYINGLQRLDIDPHEVEGLPLPKWTVDAHLKFMNDAGIGFTVLSMPSPHIYNGDAKEKIACQVAREINTELAEVCRVHPDKFGFVAVLPMPSVDGSVNEINYTMSKLGALGVKVASNSDGVYLGDEIFDPIFEELNSRQALVIIHPSPAQKLPRSDVVTGNVMALYEHPSDTTRAVLNMIANGTLEKFPKIKFVVPHCGSFMPYMKQRADSIFKTLAGMNITNSVDVETELKKFYFDLAGDPMPEQMDMLLKITDGDHLLYGSDFPYIPAQVLLDNKKSLDDELDKRDLTKKVYCDNAEILLGE